MVMTIAGLMSEAAGRCPDRTALIIGDRTLRFRELESFSSRVASGLIECGVAPGDRVSLFGRNSWHTSRRATARSSIDDLQAAVTPIAIDQTAPRTMLRV
jgi:acyl-CoA synthetase (AMP-forming)/AMP-acid ligase II